LLEMKMSQDKKTNQLWFGQLKSRIQSSLSYNKQSTKYQQVSINQPIRILYIK
jgi:hypothetical protein